MSLQVAYMDVPVGVQQSVADTSSSGQPFSENGWLSTRGVADIPWATLESGAWALDGTRKLLPDRPRQMGWWSQEASDMDGRFENPPVLVVSLSKPSTATGLTFRFCPSMNQWCSHIKVFWYRERMLLDWTDIYPTAAEWLLFHPVENFDRVEIYLLKTNLPGCFAKLQQFQIGRVMLFSGDELVKVRLLNETDPSMCALPVDTMTVEIRERKSRILQPQKDQTVQLYQNGIPLATHYITDAQRESQRNYRLRSQSVIGKLEDTFLGGVYQQYPLENLLQEVLGEFPFRMDSAFAGKTLTGYLPVGSRRRALQQIAFAVGAVVTTRGDGCVYLRVPEESVSSRFESHEIFAGAKLKQELPVAAVELYVHSYAPNDEEKVLLKEAEIFGEDVLYVFSEPYHTYQIAGGSLVDSGANWVKITANGPVTLTAKKYRHTISVWRKENPKATVVERGNVVAVEGATLIHAGNADAALQRLYNYHTMSDVLTQDVVITGQQAGQMVESLSPWGTPIVGHIVAMESEFTNGGRRANIQIRGMEEQTL